MKISAVTKNYTASWAGGYATLTETEDYCLWSLSPTNNKFKEILERKAKSKEHAIKNIFRHIGFKPEFQLHSEIKDGKNGYEFVQYLGTTEDGIKQSKQQEWLEKWKKNGKKSLFV